MRGRRLYGHGLGALHLALGRAGPRDVPWGARPTLRRCSGRGPGRRSTTGNTPPSDGVVGAAALCGRTRGCRGRGPGGVGHLWRGTRVGEIPLLGAQRGRTVRPPTHTGEWKRQRREPQSTQGDGREPQEEEQGGNPPDGTHPPPTDAGEVLQHRGPRPAGRGFPPGGYVREWVSQGSLEVRSRTRRCSSMSCHPPRGTDRGRVERIALGPTVRRARRVKVGRLA